MTTEFISLQAPPGTSISHYDRKATHNAQADSHIPHVFLEAMGIREEVFVKEQHVPLENELDEDDPRSFHWVTYVSVGSGAGGSNTNNSGSSKSSSSTASRLAVGTVRLVPPPHPPHSHNAAEGAEPDAHANTTSKFNPHNEPYVKIGRLAILKPYRGLGLAKLLMDTALTWAASHPNEILPPLSAADREVKKMEGDIDDVGERWKGLVLVHSQSYLEDLYKRRGFERDESMGEWDEEGIMHIGMWKRLHVKEK